MDETEDEVDVRTEDDDFWVASRARMRGSTSRDDHSVVKSTAVPLSPPHSDTAAPVAERSEMEPGVAEFMSLGFSEADARAAIIRYGDVNEAANALFAEADETPPPTPSNGRPSSPSHPDWAQDAAGGQRCGPIPFSGRGHGEVLDDAERLAMGLEEEEGDNSDAGAYARLWDGERSPREPLAGNGCEGGYDIELGADSRWSGGDGKAVDVENLDNDSEEMGSAHGQPASPPDAFEDVEAGMYLGGLWIDGTEQPGADPMLAGTEPMEMDASRAEALHNKLRTDLQLDISPRDVSDALRRAGPGATEDEVVGQLLMDSGEWWNESSAPNLPSPPSQHPSMTEHELLPLATLSSTEGATERTPLLGQRRRGASPPRGDAAHCSLVILAGRHANVTVSRHGMRGIQLDAIPRRTALVRRELGAAGLLQQDEPLQLVLPEEAVRDLLSQFPAELRQNLDDPLAGNTHLPTIHVQCLMSLLTVTPEEDPASEIVTAGAPGRLRLSLGEHRGDSGFWAASYSYARNHGPCDEADKQPSQDAGMSPIAESDQELVSELPDSDVWEEEEELDGLHGLEDEQAEDDVAPGVRSSAVPDKSTADGNRVVFAKNPLARNGLQNPLLSDAAARKHEETPAVGRTRNETGLHGTVRPVLQRGRRGGAPARAQAARNRRAGALAASAPAPDMGDQGARESKPGPPAEWAGWGTRENPWP